MNYSVFVWILAMTLPLLGNFGPSVVYNLSSDPVDVVIPCAPKDARTLSLCIQGIRQYGQNIRRVIVVSKEPLSSEAEWFAEARYPFSKEKIAMEIFKGDEKVARKFLSQKHSRSGWIFQQLLKLYAPLVIPDISSNVLIVDADVIFVQPVAFLNEQNGPFFNPTIEYHRPYFDHMKKLLPGLSRLYPEHSGVAHHMLFQRPILEDLFAKITQVHQVEPWQAICRCIGVKEVQGSCLSEYEIYFNFALARTHQAQIRVLPFLDTHSLGELERYAKQGYAYITSHERP